MTKEFIKLNNIIGWIVCAIATFTYCSTIEPTASFWDCGEYIACSYKLEVGHPPGAPFFLLIGRFFSLMGGRSGTGGHDGERDERPIQFFQHTFFILDHYPFRY
ncbi:MAG TPA: DUF2723 domain-containing protein [Bacteroidia bacterium]|nr:DUF2723 domain-containing protein [Bacteroidia bacterium]